MTIIDLEAVRRLPHPVNRDSITETIEQLRTDLEAEADLQQSVPSWDTVKVETAHHMIDQATLTSTTRTVYRSVRITMTVQAVATEQAVAS